MEEVKVKVSGSEAQHFSVEPPELKGLFNSSVEVHG